MLIDDGEHVTWCFVGIYGQPQEHRRYLTWELLGRLMTMVGGDFNKVMELAEIQGWVWRT